MKRAWPFLFLLAVRALAQNDPPAALVLEAKAWRYLPAGATLELDAKPGDVLFARDTLRGAGTLRLIDCVAKTVSVINGAAEIVFDARGAQFKSASAASSAPSAGCPLPPVSRTTDANRRHAEAAEAMKATPPSGTYEQHVAALPAAQRSALVAEAEPLRRALAAEPKETVLRLPLVRTLEKFGLRLDAAAELRTVAAEWPDAAWVKAWIFDLEKQGSRGAEIVEDPARKGKTFALLVGISEFGNAAIPKLNYAHEDASSMRDLLTSPRGGGVPAENITLLMNRDATTAKIRGAIESSLKPRANPDDTILLLVASHGVVANAGQKGPQGFILTYDSDPEDLATTALPMADIKRLFEEEMPRGRRLWLFIDVCHAGQIGQIISPLPRTSSEAEKLAQDEGKFYGLLAAQSNQAALEGAEYGGGHGAFTYFMLDGWNGSADEDGDGKITMGEFNTYVVNSVRKGTGRKQTPKAIGVVEEEYPMGHTALQGIALAPFGQKVLLAKRDAPAPQAGRGLVAPPQDSIAANLERQVDEGIATGRLPNSDADAVFLQVRTGGQRAAKAAARLRIALEEAGQRVLLRYLQGDQIPQTRADFQRGAEYFSAAALLAPDSLYLEARILFCRGRVLIFDKQYREAAELLERSVRLDSTRAYSYNALGIAYLEQALFPRAIAAFLEATRRAPYWAYPLHNLALSLSESGDYREAIRTYQRAMRLAPGAFYLPYNLGLLFERMNRRSEAEASFRRAMSLSNQQRAEPYTALGHLKAEQRREADAERLYRQAIDLNPELLEARHNLAVLLAGQATRSGEALPLWRENLARSRDYLPSRISLARALDRLGKRDEAIVEYREVLRVRPEYVAARLALAKLLQAAGNNSEALQEARAAAVAQPGNAEVLEMAGDLESAAGNFAAAATAYRQALNAANQKQIKKRLQEKLGH